MSLVTLTFGNGKTGTMTCSEPPAVSTPEDRIVERPLVESKLTVKKVCQFFGHTDVYLVGQIVSGVVASNMRGKIGEQTFEIVELESKIGKRIAKEGMTVGLTIRGVPKEAFAEGSMVSFS